jgi:hypothetical protein
MNEVWFNYKMIIYHGILYLKKWMKCDGFIWVARITAISFCHLIQTYMYSGTIWIEKLCHGIEYPYFHAEPTKEELGWE